MVEASDVVNNYKFKYNTSLKVVAFQFKFYFIPSYSIGSLTFFLGYAAHIYVYFLEKIYIN